MNSAAAPGIDAGRRRRQLPAEVSAFVGRTDELGALAGLLRRGRHVTVTGPGGVGKTRLALRAAADAASRYADGTRLVELSGLADAALLPATVAQCLGLRGHDPRPARAAVLDHLRGQRLLLILDTCEHLTAAVARFASQVLRETDGITILTTSRQPLHLAGEQVLRLGPLPVPEAGRDPGPGGAVELFATRAAAAVGGFTISDAELPDVIRICRRLDGVPLGVELAAVRVRALPLAELADRLDAAFSVLAGGRRGAVPRHQTLRAAIDWSYDLCTEAERAVWERLSVFAGPFDLAAARDVAACPLVPAGQVGDVLAGLVDKSVVLQEDGPPASGVPRPDHSRPGDGSGARYRLIGSVREYGVERLAAADQEADCRRRHARRYLRMALSFRRHLLADDQTARLRELRGRARRAHRRARARFRRRRARPATGRGAARDRAAPLLAHVGAAARGHPLAERGPAPGRPSRQRSSRPRRRARWRTGRCSAPCSDCPRRWPTPGRPSHWPRGPATTGPGGFGYLALQLALGARRRLPGVGRGGRAGAPAPHRGRLGRGPALLDVQLGQAHQLDGNFAAAAAAGQRALAGLGPGERWLHGYVADHLRARALPAAWAPAGVRGRGRRGRCARCTISGTRSARPTRSRRWAGWRPTTGGSSAPPGCSGRRRRAGS